MSEYQGELLDVEFGQDALIAEHAPGHVFVRKDLRLQR